MADNPDGSKILGKASFSVSSRVALQLGRESISSSITAIVELVKNSYDADADVVRIRFANLGTPQALLVIEDTGDGMTVEDLRRYWMVIGTSNKTGRRRTTGRQRVVTGEKGLGRLGLDRLCERTEVESIRLGAHEGVRLDIQWSRYEGSEHRLEAIEHDLYSVPNLKRDPISGAWGDYPKGTRLVLRGLKDSWEEESIGELKRELGLLVSPFQAPNDFTVELDTGGKYGDKGLDGPVTTQKPLLDAANWRVTATLDEEGKIEVAMTSPRHSTQYHLKPTHWSEAIKKQGLAPHCGPLRMEFYFYVRRDAELTAQTIRAAEIVNFLRFNQGIRIYRDGFRVKPYGEPDGNGDWLRLAFRRMQNPEGVAQDARPGNWRVGYNQIVGAVFITHEKNAGLNDQTNREGLLQGKAFDHLRVFALRIVQFFEIHHQTFEMGRKAARATAEHAEEKALSSIAEVSKAIEELGNLAAQMPNSPALPSSQSSQAKEAVEGVQRRLAAATAGLEESARLFRDAEEQKNTMANLASLGILAAAFGHETLDWTGTVAKNSRWLLDNMARNLFMVGPDIEKDVKTALEDTEAEAQKVRKFARFTLGNLSRSKRQRRDFDLVETVRRVFDAFDEVLRIQRGTKVTLDGLPAGPCPMNGFEMDWESIVVNLITNATWALEEKPAHQREIAASIVDGTSDWLFLFEDSGVGLEAGTEHMIFLPAFSTKRSLRGEIVGTGMGLFIVKSFVEDHSGGTISAQASGRLGGASFEIRVPKASKPSVH